MHDYAPELDRLVTCPRCLGSRDVAIGTTGELIASCSTCEYTLKMLTQRRVAG
jgi:transcription elongation factor Elf1